MRQPSWGFGGASAPRRSLLRLLAIAPLAWKVQCETSESLQTLDSVLNALGPSASAMTVSPPAAEASTTVAASVEPVLLHASAPLGEAPSEVAHTVGERIEQDSKNVGLVAKRLMEVQTKIDAVEHEVLGKVFDMQSLRNFLESHWQSSDNEVELRQSVAAASAETATLTEQLKTLKEASEKQHAEHLVRMATMEAALAHGKAEQGLREERRALEQAALEKAAMKLPPPAPVLAPIENVVEEVVVMEVKIENVDFAALSANPTLLHEFEQGVANTVATGAGVDANDVQLDFAAGSVVVIAVFPEPPEFDLVKMNEKSGALGSALATGLSHIDLGDIVTGPIGVSVDVTVQPAGAPAPAFPPPSAPAPAPAAEEQVLTSETNNLAAENANLTAQDAEQAKVTAMEMKELVDARSELQKRKIRILELEAEIRQQHSYAGVCHGQAEKLRGQLSAEENRIKAEKTRISDQEQQHLVRQQQFIQQNRKLKLRLNKAKANLGTIQSQIIGTKQRHVSLEQQGSVHMGKLRGALGTLRSKAEQTEVELNAHVEARVALEKKVLVAQKEVEKLQAIILSGRLAELRANNSMYKRDIELAHGEMQKSEANKVTTEAAIQTTNVTITALRADAEAGALRARDIAKESLAQVSDAKAADDESTQKADDAAMSAEADLLTDCIGIWDKDHPDVLAELATCPQLKQDLANAHAQVATLSSTVMSG